MHSGFRISKNSFWNLLGQKQERKKRILHPVPKPTVLKLVAGFEDGDSYNH
jgi:hypothetical protein